MAETLRQAIRAALTFKQWRDGEERLAHDFRDTPRRRHSQAAQAACFAQQFATPLPQS